MISIITPVFNGAKYIKQNIESILNLEIPFEHIIVDGGSTDGTIELIQKYPHIKLLIQDGNGGMYEAIDIGIRHATFKYVSWINADDFINPIFYSKFVVVSNKKKYDFAYSNAYHYYLNSSNKRKIYAKHFTRFLLKIGVFPFVQSSVLFKKEVYLNIGGFRYDLFKIIGDRDLFQRFAYNNSIKFGYINVFSSYFLMHDDSLLHKNKELRLKEQLYCIKSLNNPLMGIYFRISNIIRRII